MLHTTRKQLRERNGTKITPVQLNREEQARIDRLIERYSFRNTPDVIKTAIDYMERDLQRFNGLIVKMQAAKCMNTKNENYKYQAMTSYYRTENDQNNN